MSRLISLDNISLAFGLDSLLDHVKLQIMQGDRVGVIGRNGAGKSSLLKIIAGSLQPDSGTIWRKPGLRLARLAQELPQSLSMSVFEYVAEGLAETGNLLVSYYKLIHQITDSHTQKALNDLEQLQRQMDAKNAWLYEQTIKTVLTRLALNPDTLLSELSGGWQRRAALAQVLVTSPELLLLDEPTNHLDIETIQWLEDQLINWNIGLVLITHDRALLKRLATRIVELDRGNLTTWPGNYQHFLTQKTALLNAEEKQNAVFDKKLAQEEKWIRQGIKARRTRNEGRVRALEALRRQREERRDIQGKVRLGLNSAEQSGQLVIEAKHITQIYNNKTIIHDFSVQIMRGDRIGLIGPNGIGKSVLLNMLLQKIAPQQGSVKLGTKLDIAYFDQLRAALDLEKTVAENVSQGCDMIEFNGQKRHIISYLGDFLFTPQRAMTPIKALSGGECNRLLLAKLFSRPNNLLIMDEPTNDLDIETLELLEELLLHYQGTLLLVSHDRDFLDHVVTSTLVFMGNGQIEEYVGGYKDWLQQKKSTVSIVSPKVEIQAKRTVINKTKKLTHREQQELKELPILIEKLETEQAQIEQLIADPTFYQKSHTKVSETLNTLNQVTKKLEEAYQRWSKLEK